MYDTSGENNGNSRLTLDQVENIRKRAKWGSCKSLAEEYGVSIHMIYKIKQGRRWKESTK